MATKTAAKKPRPAKPTPKAKTPTAVKSTKKPATVKSTKTAASTRAKAPVAKAKATPKKTAAKKAPVAKEFDEHGFVVGTDSSKIAAILVAGGKDRKDINAKADKKIGGQTRNGTEKNTPALVSGVLNRLLKEGYKVESTFVLVPPKRRRKPSTTK